MTKTLLDVRDLTIMWDDVRIVGPISFQIQEGRIGAIVGESGSGKSVTLHSLVDVLDSRFEVTMSGLWKDLELSPEVLRRLRGNKTAIVFQDPGSYFEPRWTVEKTLGEVLPEYRRKDRTSVIGQLLKHVDLTRDVANKHAFQLSGGMLQRIALAKALAVEPELVLADEITSALDEDTRDQILALLRRQARDFGRTVILVSHDLPAVSQAVDHVWVMYGGLIVESGPVYEVMERPRHPYSDLLIQAVPRGRHKGSVLPEIPGTQPPVGRYPAGCPFHPRCPNAKPVCRSEMPETEGAAGHYWRCWNPVRR